MKLIAALGRGKCALCRKHIFPKEFKLEVEEGQNICLFCLKLLQEQEASDVRKESSC